MHFTSEPIQPVQTPASPSYLWHRLADRQPGHACRYDREFVGSVMLDLLVDCDPSDAVSDLTTIALDVCRMERACRKAQCYDDRVEAIRLADELCDEAWTLLAGIAAANPAPMSKVRKPRADLTGVFDEWLWGRDEEAETRFAELEKVGLA